ncbi:protein obstructor-E-like [Bradysia coprophila]|uniref:protein obstructor-E-like n=1 Tax=Bradysia coprophila TaxID=38358 RepID=UPI00187DC978|nr:protein obstructor-E-like [Bradysia coprophila]
MNILLFICSITIGVVSAQNFGCPPDGIHAIKYPGSCRRFIRCVFGNGVVMDCAPGLYFDSVRGQCNTADIANCNPCRDNPVDQITFTRDAFNCARFSMCIGRSHSENSCSDGLYFDTRTNTCALSENVDCTGQGEGTTTTTTRAPGDELEPGPDGSCDKDSNFEVIASPSSCDRYTICTCGYPNPQTCPPGLIFDVVSQQCNTREQGLCLFESIPPCPDGTVEVFAHPYDCRHLIFCILGTPTLEACAPGLEVNRRTNKCDFRHIAQCSSRTALTYTQLMSGMSFL